MKIHNKKFIVIPFFLLMAWIGFVIWVNPAQRYPFPYKFSGEILSPEAINQAENSDILIVGDRLALPLNEAADFIKEETSQQLKSPLKIFNWGEFGEGLHRTLHKIKSLKKIPGIVVYLGGSQEFHEEKFNIKNYSSIKWNFHLSSNDYLSSLFMLWKWPSKLIYFPVDYQIMKKEMNQLSPKNRPLSPEEEISRDFEQRKHEIRVLRKLEINFKLYEAELEELIFTLLAQNSHPIFVSTPIPLGNPTKKVCFSSTNFDLDQKLKSFEKQLNENSVGKEDLTNLIELKEKHPQQAMISYLVGKTFHKFQRFERALDFYQESEVFDCDENKEGHFIFNAIQKKLTGQQEIPYIDFHALVYKNYKGEGPSKKFLEGPYPHSTFYKELTTDLIKKIKAIYDLK